MSEVSIHLQRVNSVIDFSVNGVTYQGDRKVVQVSSGQSSILDPTAPSNSPIPASSRVEIEVERANDFTQFTVRDNSYQGRQTLELGGVRLVQQAVPAPTAPGGSTVSAVTFTGQILVTVDHYRGYRPPVTITNTNGDVISGAIQHLSLNTFTVAFNVPQSGQIIYE